MTRQPRIMIALSLAYLLVAVSMPLQVVFLSGYNLTDVDLIWAQLTVLNIAIMITCALVGVCLYISSRFTMMLLPLLSAMILYNNFLVGQFEYQYTSLQALLASAGFLSLSGAVYFIPLVRQPLLDRSRRWWKTPKRMATAFETYLHPFVGPSLSGATFDLSESGFFIADEVVKAKGASSTQFTPQEGLKVGDRTGVSIKISPGLSVKCEARIVRRSNGQGRYPKGFGFQFERIDNQHRKMIRQMIQDAVSA